ncbi:aminodeoxychorismate synthase, component I [Natronoglomus mannanivorans]|uniref:anthranilate synthase n=1 Tax=Natronoglomus mannanivorans TaxID=2979990 RepID=A0AAP2YYJ6_9EURY|nr:aminodeoxychorismate synthase, component I [Halobacteria archaeon AArc-xg1-1]
MNEPRVHTTLESFRSVAADAPDGATAAVRVPVEVRVRVRDPFLAYRRARGAVRARSRSSSGSDSDSDSGFAADSFADPDSDSDSGTRSDPAGVFLETTGGQRGWGYFGLEPVERLTVSPDAVSVAGEAGGDSSESVIADSDFDSDSDSGSSESAAWDPSPSHSQSSSPSLEALEGLLAGETLLRGDCEVPYPCGAVGWLSYDIVRELEDLPESAVDDRGLPRLEVGRFDCLASWKAPTDGAVTLRITACPRVDGDHDPDDAYERGRERALEFARTTLEGDPGTDQPPVTTDEARFESDCGREAFAGRVRRVKEYVRDGDTFQANISQRLVAPAAVHPVAAYDALRRVNPAPYSCLLEFRGADLISASPELLLERNGDFLRTEPIAGTRPRGATPEEDESLEADLLGDEKERAEHAMLVDLERNDLGKVSEYGSVAVEEYRRVDRYSEVMHLVSNVTGRLREGETLADAIAAVFPGGTITGAPKPRTMEIIDELEATQRGPYTGSVGIFGLDGRATLNIVIRTLVRYDEEYHLRVGAGIVHDSDPYREYDETLAKARALITAVDEALGEQAAMTVEASDGGVERTPAKLEQESNPKPAGLEPDGRDARGSDRETQRDDGGRDE